ncbi:MAG: class I SAM-dependent methyltransferase [Ignavibacterium sp.]|mgnify:CR=1 FL=1|jgi:cyclopropane fatty-acyl-phospholipid synthase-like methyltransferase|nr:class I SAM-dependent methyltransferase [Ignavibacterium sp.]
MKSLEESVITAMDGSDIKIFPYLPYILQDLWELGAIPDTMIKLIKKHFTDYSNLKVLDLGCGKGAVSVKISQQLNCFCYGIDAVQDFITYARQKAKEYSVEQLCRFEVGDIREKVKYISGYDTIILGAIGPVFGDYFTTLNTLSDCLNETGIILIDDSYIEDSSEFTHPLIFKKSDITQQIEKAGMIISETDIFKIDDIKQTNDYMFDKLKARCYELIEKNPDKENLFIDYIKKQEKENVVLENKIIAVTLVIKKKQKL